MEMRHRIEGLVRRAIEESVESGELEIDDVPENPSVEHPRDKGHGDWASSVAMKLAKQAHMNPRQIAQIIVSHMETGPLVESIEIAGPGFINMTVSNEALYESLRDARLEGPDYGRCDVGQGRSVQIEFVSANPTGPMHVGHGRWAPLGDALGNLLDHAGWKVEREFYINDAGSQMQNFALSIEARYLQLCGLEAQLPENGYGGSYVTDIAKQILDEDGHKWLDTTSAERVAEFKERGYHLMLDHMEEVLSGIGVKFDVWFSERTLYEKDGEGKSQIDRVLDRLSEEGYTYEKDGALWLRTTELGDDKDRVLVKSDGDYTYFTPDIAYHYGKFERGFDRVIDIWGADHHGYVKRMQGAMKALGNEGKLDVLLGQLVNLLRGGEPVRMSKRTGEMVTFEELVDEVGADATKYIMLSKSADQAIDFDIEAAVEQNSSNPVYYVQYAHARICSIERRAGRPINEDADLSLLTDPSELELARKISEFGETVEDAAREYAPFRITHYAESLAAAFHRFYKECQIIIEDDEALSDARLYLADAAKSTIACALGILGVSAPERM